MPEWKYNLKGFEDIFENEDLTERSNAIAGKLARLQERMRGRETGWVISELDDLIEDFRTYGIEDGESYFETLMENLYDWADSARVWIEPRSRVK